MPISTQISAFAPLASFPQAPPGPTDLDGWPHRAEVPFPVEPVFRVRPDLVKLGTAPLWIEDHLWPQWVAQKHWLMGQARLPIAIAGLGASMLEQLAGLVQDAVAADHGPIDHHGGFRWLGGFRARNSEEFFSALTLSVQEDFVLMRPGANGDLRAVLMSVAFPSGWSPEEKLGQSMIQIHQPVAENDALQRATPAMSEAMLEKGPFVRYVWTLAGNDVLSRQPGADTLADVSRVDQLWFRCERQVTVPLAGFACLFLIRVFVARLTDVLAAPGRRDLLIQSLQSMSESVIDYKGIARARRLILEQSSTVLKVS